MIIYLNRIRNQVNFRVKIKVHRKFQFRINTSNFIIPRLRGITVEQDYEVSAQRRVLVATQHLGFDELFDSAGGKAAATHAVFNNDV